MDSAPNHGVSRGSKALIHLVPRSKDLERFEDAVRSAASELRSRCAATGSRVNPMFRVKGDPLGRRTLFHGTLEVTGGDATTGSLSALANHLPEVLGDVAHFDLSSFLVGEEISFLGGSQTPVRYQYLMRRKSELSNLDYRKHYREMHSRFGIETPGILGYSQFHVDLEATRRAALWAGVGIWAVDSVSQLWLESVESFIAAVSTSKINAAATADERTFIDRGHSFDFNSIVEWDDSQIVDRKD